MRQNRKEIPEELAKKKVLRNPEVFRYDSQAPITLISHQ